MIKKNFIFFILFLITFSACKKDKKQLRPDTLFISGLVTDKQTSAQLDSVSITLEYNNNIGTPAIPQTIFYSSSDGKFNFQFAPKENYTYQLLFSKTGFNASWKAIDRDKEFQEFNVALEK